jgi:hypothetical protein
VKESIANEKTRAAQGHVVKITPSFAHDVQDEWRNVLILPQLPMAVSKSGVMCKNRFDRAVTPASRCQVEREWLHSSRGSVG